MSGINKVILIGHLGADPELRYLPDGTAVASIRMATSETWKDREGKKQEKTEWHRVVLWRKTAEIASEYLKKGSQVFIEGKLQTREYVDKEGVKRWATDVVAREMQMLGSRGGGTASTDYYGDPPPIKEPDLPNGADDDIPF